MGLYKQAIKSLRAVAVADSMAEVSCNWINMVGGQQSGQCRYKSFFVSLKDDKRGSNS